MSQSPRYYPIPKETDPFVSVTSVTAQIAKPGLMYFYGKHGIGKAQELSKQATDIGQFVDEYIINYFDKPGTKMLIRKGAEQCIRNFHLFVSKFQPVPILKQQMVYARSKRYAGTLDIIFRIKSNLAVILGDWKTSGNIYHDYELQLEAYYRAIIEMVLAGELDLGGEEISGLWVIRLSKDSIIDFDDDIRKFNPDEFRFKAFLGLLDYFFWSHSKDLIK